MIIKPNKEKGQKAKYEEVDVVYFVKTSKVTLTNRHRAVQAKTLKEIRWITKNMMNLELIFGTIGLTQSKEALNCSRSRTLPWWPNGLSPSASTFKESRTSSAFDQMSP